jgi:O-antigen ligase
MAWYLASVASGANRRWVNRGYFVIGVVAILLTGSRGAMLATIVALSVIPWTLTHLRRGVRIGAVVIMLGAGVAAMLFVPAASFERLSTTRTEISQGTMNSRLEIWRRGLLAVPGRPLHGYGPAGWRPAVSHRFGVKGAHNTFLAILVEEGFIGLLLYLGIFALVLKGILALPTFPRRVGLTLLATLVTALTPLDWDTRKPAWVLLALLVAFSEVPPHGRRAGSPPATAPGYGPTSRQPVRMARRIMAK